MTRVRYKSRVVPNHCCQRGVCLYRDCFGGSPIRCAVFPRLPAFSRIAHVFANEHANCLRRVRGTKRGLVFSLARARLSHATQQKERSRLHVQVRTAFCNCANICCGDTLCESAARLENVPDAWLQCRQGQICRSHARAETGVKHIDDSTI